MMSQEKSVPACERFSEIAKRLKEIAAEKQQQAPSGDWTPYITEAGWYEVDRERGVVRKIEGDPRLYGCYGWFDEAVEWSRTGIDTLCPIPQREVDLWPGLFRTIEGDL